jgi:3-deoxy-D-manno-octulosonic acid kinase
MRFDQVWAFVVTGGLAWMERTLGGGGTLHGWASEQADRRELTGRGRVYSVPAPLPGPDRRERWVVRHYYRGGAVARLLTDRYLAVGPPRPLLEASAAGAARERGIPTPAAVAGAVYPAGAFYRADIVTEEIPQAADLAHVLFGSDPTPAEVEREAALTAAGRLVRTLEQAGLLHPDLNAKNIVLHPAEDGPRAHLVDLDRCCARAAGVPAPAFPMRRRLERSLRKFQMRTGRGLGASEWAALRRGFGEEQ